MPSGEVWRAKLRTASVMTQLCRAQLLVSWVPFHRWRQSLGLATGRQGQAGNAEDARRLAADVAWAAKRFPFSAKCLPQAMALSWMLRKKGIEHSVVLAVRPADSRESAEALHAWVEIDGQKMIGDLPGPWIETLRLSA